MKKEEEVKRISDTLWRVLLKNRNMLVDKGASPNMANYIVMNSCIGILSQVLGMIVFDAEGERQKVAGLITEASRILTQAVQDFMLENVKNHKITLLRIEPNP